MAQTPADLAFMDVTNSTKMDSGVETGTDSNDSCVTQHNSVVTINAGEGPCKTTIIINNIIDSDSSQPAILNTAIAKVTQFPRFFPIDISRNQTMIEFNTLGSHGMLDFMESKFMGKERRYIKRVRDYRSKYTKQSKYQLMAFAAITNNTESMERFLKQGISPNNIIFHGQSPLHLAASRGYREIVALLLNYGAYPNLRDKNGKTALHLAVLANHTSIVTMLLAAGSNICSSDDEGHNPLQLAQTKLRSLQKYGDGYFIREEIQKIVGSLLTYLRINDDTKAQVESLSNFCAKLSLANNADQIQDDVRSLLANLDSLRITN